MTTTTPVSPIPRRPRRRSLRLLVPIAAVALAACASDPAEPDEPADSVETAVSIEAVSETLRLTVGPALVECEGVGPQMCMLVRESVGGEWELFDDEIVGFSHTPGTTSTLLVEVIERERPPADASSRSYELLEVIETSAE